MFFFLFYSAESTFLPQREITLFHYIGVPPVQLLSLLQFLLSAVFAKVMIIVKGSHG